MKAKKIVPNKKREVGMLLKIPNTYVLCTHSENMSRMLVGNYS